MCVRPCCEGSTSHLTAFAVSLIPACRRQQRLPDQPRSNNRGHTVGGLGISCAQVHGPQARRHAVYCHGSHKDLSPAGNNTSASRLWPLVVCCRLCVPSYSPTTRTRMHAPLQEATFQGTQLITTATSPHHNQPTNQQTTQEIGSIYTDQSKRTQEEEEEAAAARLPQGQKQGFGTSSESIECPHIWTIALSKQRHQPNPATQRMAAMWFSRRLHTRHLHEHLRPNCQPLLHQLFCRVSMMVGSLAS